MFKFRWNSQWVLFFLFLLDMLMILGFIPVKSWANTLESAVSTDSSILSPIKNAKIVSTQEPSPAYVPEGSNSEVDQITPVSQLLSPTTNAIPSTRTSSSDPTADNDDPTTGQVNSVSQLSDVQRCLLVVFKLEGVQAPSNCFLLLRTPSKGVSS